MLLLVECTQDPKLGRLIQVSAGIVICVAYAACCAHCTVYHDNKARHAGCVAGAGAGSVASLSQVSGSGCCSVTRGKHLSGGPHVSRCLPWLWLCTTACLAEQASGNGSAGSSNLRGFLPCTDLDRQQNASLLNAEPSYTHLMCFVCRP